MSDSGGNDPKENGVIRAIAKFTFSGKNNDEVHQIFSILQQSF